MIIHGIQERCDAVRLESGKKRSKNPSASVPTMAAKANFQVSEPMAFFCHSGSLGEFGGFGDGSVSVWVDIISGCCESNETKMSCCDRGRAGQRMKWWKSRKTRSYAGSQSARSHG